MLCVVEGTSPDLRGSLIASPLIVLEVPYSIFHLLHRQALQEGHPTLYKPPTGFSAMERIIRHHRRIPSVASRFPLSSIFRRWRGYSPLETDAVEMSSRESGSYDEKVDVKEGLPGIAISEVSPHHVAFTTDQVDTAAQLVAGQDFELDPEEAARVRKKIDWHILPMMCSKFLFHSSLARMVLIRPPVLYWVQFMDKTTLGSSAILGIR